MSWWEPSRTWCSGRWSLQVSAGGLEEIGYDGVTLLRGIRAVVRDHDWATAALHLDQVVEAEDSLDLVVHTSALGARLSGHVRVRARGADLRVDLDLHSDGDLNTNRTGLVVLHPPDLGGTKVQVTHPDGATEQVQFPVSISPHQPMRDIRGLQWACGEAGVQVWFEGDVFEMEDQRNWSDASYKTYSRPLDLPFPYRLRAGERVRQWVRVQVWDAAGSKEAGPDGGRAAGAGEGALGEGIERGNGRDAAVAASVAARSDGLVRAAGLVCADGLVRAAGLVCADGPQHAATLGYAGTPSAPDATSHSQASDLIDLRPGAPFPDLQLGASTAPDPAPTLPRKRAGGSGQPEVPGAARVVELDLGSPAWPAALDRAARSGLPLDVRVVLPDDHTEYDPAECDHIECDQTEYDHTEYDHTEYDHTEYDHTESPGGSGAGEGSVGVGRNSEGGGAAELGRAARMLRKVNLLRISAYQGAGPAAHVSDEAATGTLRAVLERAGIEAPIVGGARSHFTEYNRQHHLVPQGVAGAVFGITPLFHELSTRQLVESVAMQRLIARQATSMTSLPVHLGPVTLRPRFNNVATTPAPRPDRSDLSAGYGPELLDATDVRQQSPELAAWTIASAAALAVPGVASLTYFEDWGPRGIHDSSGAPYPVAEAIEALDALRGGRTLTGDSPDGLIWAVGATWGSRSGERERTGSAAGVDVGAAADSETSSSDADLGTDTGAGGNALNPTAETTVLVANLDLRRRDVTVVCGSSVWRCVLGPGAWQTLP